MPYEIDDPFRLYLTNEPAEGVSHSGCDRSDKTNSTSKRAGGTDARYPTDAVAIPDPLPAMKTLFVSRIALLVSYS